MKIDTLLSTLYKFYYCIIIIIKEELEEEGTFSYIVTIYSVSRAATEGQRLIPSRVFFKATLSAVVK